MSSSHGSNASSIYCTFEISQIPRTIIIGNRTTGKEGAGRTFTGSHGDYKSSGTLWENGKIEVYIKPNIKNPTSVETGASFNELFLRYLRGELKDSEFNLLLKQEVELS